MCKVWQYGLWSFQTGGTKLERFLPKNHHTQRKLLNFDNWVNGEVSKSAKIWLSKSIFCIKNYPKLSHFFLLTNINLGTHFLLLTFFDNINFWITLLSNNLPFNLISFEYVDSNFVPPAWILHNPYCHNEQDDSQLGNKCNTSTTKPKLR